VLKREFFELLEAARLDKTYVRGERNRLFYEEGGRSFEVLDMVGGFGATMLGHNPPEVVAEIRSLLDAQVPLASQGSVRSRARRLADRLSELVSVSPDRPYRCVLTNSGAETVEAALKHAELARQGKIEALRARISRALADMAHAERVGVPLVPSPEARERLAGFGLAAGAGAAELKAALESNHRLLDLPPVFFALQKSFHGKTSGALQLTHSKDYRRGFEALGPGSDFLEFGDTEAPVRALAKLRASLWVPVAGPGGVLEFVEERVHPVAAFVVEPVQGEGGIRPISATVLQAYRRFCDESGIPLVFDEIQCGMGRTGTFLASQAAGVAADYVLLSKSLGGGVLKIGALLVAEEKYVPEFSLMHTSTFAEDEISSAAALKTLELLTADGQALLKKGAAQGEKLRAGLEAIKARYPDVIADVRGRGLMLGVQFRDFEEAESHSIRMADKIGKFTLMAAGNLLHEKRVRILPTLQDPRTVRLEPSVHLSDEEIAAFVDALESLCLVLRRQDDYSLFRFLLGKEGVEPPKPLPAERLALRSLPRVPRYARKSQAPKVAFLAHFIEPANFRRSAIGCSHLTDSDGRKIFRSLKPIAKPWHAASVDIRSPAGGLVNFNPIVLPITTEQVVRAHMGEERSWLRALVEEAVDEAVALGCGLVGLGQFTSIVTDSGRDIRRDDVFVTSGNSLTAALGVEAIRALSQGKGRTLAAIGATGNICEAYVRRMHADFERVYLVGRSDPKARARLEALAKRLAPQARVQMGPDGAVSFVSGSSEILVADDLSCLPGADVVLAATSATEPFIRSEHLRAGAVVCDLSVPRNVHPSVASERPDVRVVHGGVARLPGKESMHLPDFPPGPGRVYACMAETMLLGMRGFDGHFSYGAVEDAKMDFILQCFREEGFEMELDLR
jgi:acetylornithine/succinyldiaminopimelate/putrescine aminotransferase/predicted amino acid dehydrogenase